MRKGLKRVVAVLSTVALFLGSMQTMGSGQVKTVGAAGGVSETGNGEEGIRFADDKVYLQLTDKLTDMPSGIEADIRLEAQDDADISEWTLISAGEDMAAAVGKQAEPAYAQTVGYGVVNENIGPGAGTAYSVITVSPDTDGNAETANGGLIGLYKQDISVTVPKRYDREDLALAFWLYSPDGESLPSGGIGMSSANAMGRDEIRWTTDVSVNKGLVKGWNYIELGLNDYQFSYGQDGAGDGFDCHSINCVAWYSEAYAALQTEKTFYLTDMKLVVRKEKEVLGAGIAFNEAVKNAAGSLAGTEYSQVVSGNGIVTEEEARAAMTDKPGKVLKPGTVYTSVTVYPYDSLKNTKGGYFGFWKQNLKVTLPAGADRNNLALAFWVWTDGTASDSFWPGGAVGLSSANWCGNEEIDWYANAYIKGSEAAGWRYVELDLSEYSAVQEVTGPFNYTNINYVRWYSDGARWTEEKTIKITDIQLVIKGSQSEGTYDNTAVSVREGVLQSELNGNQMIFSNTNIRDDDPANSGNGDAYALFITGGGKPSLLIGTTQYTLDCDMRTGLWTNIKVQLTEDKRVAFYINGRLMGISAAAVSRKLDDFKAKHCIGADGSGGQLFEGELKLIALYDEDSVRESWTLDGDVSDTKQPLLGNEAGSKAVFRGRPCYLAAEIPFTWQTTIAGKGTETPTALGEMKFDAVSTAYHDLRNLVLLMDVEVENKTNPGDVSAFALFTGQLELTSGGACDREELDISVSSLNWRSGSHEYAVPLSSMSAWGGSFDQKGINYMRIYMNEFKAGFTDTVSVSISNVRLVDISNERLRLSTLFSDGMLFQQNKEMNVWGYGAAGDVVTAGLYSKSTGRLLEEKTTEADSQGEWKLAFSARKGSYDVYQIVVTLEETQMVIDDVLIGELWIAGGQSNMELTVSTDMDAEAMVTDADDNYLRMFLEPTWPYGRGGDQPYEPAKDVPGAYWGYGDNGAQVGKVSSVAYTFAKKLRKELNVPIGIINTAVGGTIIETWISKEAIEEDSKVKDALKQYGLYRSDQESPAVTGGEMSTLYNQKIGPLEGMNIAGVIWYQGESNEDRAEIYDIELNLLKESWSRVFHFEAGDMPFIFTQRAPYQSATVPYNEYYPYLAESMERAWSMNRDRATAMLTIYDLPLAHVRDGVSSDPIHPREKTQVGERFFQAAKNMVYGGGEVYTAPVYEAMEIREHAVYVTLDCVGNGLKTIDGTADVHGFAVAGADGVYVNAKAKIVDKNTVMVWNDRVSDPKHVTYAWNNMNQGANLCNSSGIPASPFRTAKTGDTAQTPDPAEFYFTAQDWMYADHDVWVYDSTNTENDNRCVGFRPSFQVEGGSYTYDEKVKMEGRASLKVSYTGSCTVSPILSYESIRQDWSRFHTLTVSVYNPNETDVTLTMELTSGEKTYLVPLSEGGDSKILPGGKSTSIVTFDLDCLKQNGILAENPEAILAELSGVAFRIGAKEAGTINMDAFYFGMTEAVRMDEGKFETDECTHNGTTILVNRNDAAVGKEGYTGDYYCTACGKIIAMGTVIPAVPGEKAEGNDSIGNAEIGKKPPTGDAAEPIFWIAIMLTATMSLLVCLSVLKKKYGERRPR